MTPKEKAEQLIYRFQNECISDEENKGIALITTNLESESLVKEIAIFPQSNSDTITFPAINTITAIDNKVIIASAHNAIEISPLSSFNNGLLIEPINRLENKGISTSFFLKDNTSWSFYTNAERRLLIEGNGSVSIGTKLLINRAIDDYSSALRVNGTARFDSGIILKADSDSNSFISFNRNVKNALTSPDDGVSPFTSTPTNWAVNQNVPVFRIRHPNNISNQPNINTSLQRDFMILPYQFGTAIEYNGVVECWVGEWSIHKGLSYFDTEGKGNGWGGVLWVGDDLDLGGIRATARNNTVAPLTGNVAYGELSVEKFSGLPNGDFRLRLPSIRNEFQFVYGERGSENIIAKMNNNGFIIPKVQTVYAIPAPQKAQISFDSSDNQFKGYDGGKWINLSGDILKTGSSISSGNSNGTVFLFPHGLGSKPTFFTAQATSSAAANISYVTADETNIIVHYSLPPVAGIANLSWNWIVKK
jgi:hypothetical protein